MTEPSEPTVLVVDDEPEMVSLYAAWLESDFDVLTATGGAEALDVVDETVDVVLLDRNMPEPTGDAVLAEIRRREVGCRVAIVSAIEPSYDVIGMAFDDYLIKPIFFKELTETVERLIRLNQFDETVQEYFSLVTKIAAIQVSLPAEELETRDEFVELRSRVRAMHESIRAENAEMIGGDGFETEFKRLSRHWDLLDLATSEE